MKRSERPQWSLLVILLLTLGCAEQEERPSISELYKQELRSDTLVVPEAIRYLSRTALSIKSDAIPAGNYAPSTLASVVNEKCAESDSALSQLLTSLVSGNVKEYIPKNSYSPLASLPREPMGWESGRGDFLFPNSDEAAFAGRHRPYDGFGCDGECGQNKDLRRFFQEYECKPKLQNDAVPSNFSALDLDYIISVSETDRKDCCERLNRLLEGRTQLTRDSLSLVAKAQEKQRELDLLSVSFDDNSILGLIQKLPVKYRDKKDIELSLPAPLERFVRSQFTHDLHIIELSFFPEKALNRTLTFDQNAVLRNPKANYGPWFQALSHPDGQIYVSPLLARAPFFLCVNNGPKYYVEELWFLKKHVDREGWRSLSPSDVEAMTKRQRGYDEQYRKCINSQLFFTYAHEVAHTVGRPDSPDGTVSEFQADCFAFISTKRDTTFDVGMFSLLLENASGTARDLSQSRLSNLGRLDSYWAGKELPATAQSVVEFCAMNSPLRI